MTWIKFALWLLAIYTSYYAVLIFWDYLRLNGQADETNELELTFFDPVEPVKMVAEEPVPADKESSVISSGGGESQRVI